MVTTGLNNLSANNLFTSMTKNPKRYSLFGFFSWKIYKILVFFLKNIYNSFSCITFCYHIHNKSSSWLLGRNTF